MSVPDPGEALPYWAGLLGGRAAGDSIEMGSGTLLRAKEGTAGFAGAALELATRGGDDLSGEPVRTDDVVTDPDGREFAIRRLANVAKRSAWQGSRLGHLTFLSPDPVRAQQHFEGMGFVLSEGLGESFRWLRCNPSHHTVAFARADRPMLHHVGIELRDRSAMIDACDRLANSGQSIEYGPGRHLVGNNIFIYFRDRYGVRFEFFCEIEQIEDVNRPPLIHQQVPRAQSINLWGPQPPPEYFDGV